MPHCWNVSRFGVRDAYSTLWRGADGLLASFTNWRRSRESQATPQRFRALPDGRLVVPRPRILPPSEVNEAGIQNSEEIFRKRVFHVPGGKQRHRDRDQHGQPARIELEGGLNGARDHVAVHPKIGSPALDNTTPSMSYRPPGVLAELKKLL